MTAGERLRAEVERMAANVGWPVIVDVQNIQMVIALALLLEMAPVDVARKLRSI